jgi:hypothetical protein
MKTNENRPDAVNVEPVGGGSERKHYTTRDVFPSAGSNASATVAIPVWNRREQISVQCLLAMIAAGNRRDIAEMTADAVDYADKLIACLDTDDIGERHA